MISERNHAYIQGEVCNFLKLHGFTFWEIGKMGGVYRGRMGKVYSNQTPGVSDIIAVKDRQIYCIEIKTEKDKLRQEQYIFLTAMRNAGARCAVIRSVREMSDFLEVPPFISDPEIEKPKFKKEVKHGD